MNSKWTYDKVRQEYKYQAGPVLVALRKTLEPSKFKFGVWINDKHVLEESLTSQDIEHAKPSALNMVRMWVHGIVLAIGA